MSFTARERRNPPTRRKSCSACIRAKRRCDGISPACARCGNRGIACEYPLRKIRRAPIKEGGNGQDAILQNETEVSDFASFDFHLDEGFPQEGSPAMLLPDLDDSGCCFGPDFDLDPAPISLSPSALPDARQPMAIATMNKTVNFTSTDLVTRQLQFALDETRRAIHTMASSMTTPWSHPLLYRDEMPRAMRDAHASCAMYASKTRANAPYVLRSLESFCDELLASDPASTLRARLTHTQALILYLVMRLLDGDIHARVSAEKQLDALDKSAFALLPYVDWDNLAPPTADLVIPLYPAVRANTIWRAWAIHESARRTFCFALYFLQAYRILAGIRPPDCDHRLLLCRTLTVSSSLWGATNAVDFARGWNERRYYVITAAHVEDVLHNADADDMDAFARMLLSSAMGIEEAEGWFAARGGDLRALAECVAV